MKLYKYAYIMLCIGIQYHVFLFALKSKAAAVILHPEYAADGERPKCDDNISI